MAKKLDAEIINRAIASNAPLTLKTYKLPHDVEMNIERILGVFLDKFGQGELKDRISYCIRELAVNAKKANTKRVYFLEKNLDINNSTDYLAGMKDFKEETFENIDYWLEKQKKAGLYIKIIFHAKEDSFTIYVKNNVLISKKEQKRIHDRINKAISFNSAEESMTSIMDDSEGAGLGLVILVLMLKKIGLSKDAFDIGVVKDETVARIKIPFNKVHVENLDKLTEEIVNEIEELPQFPQNVVYIQELLKKPDSELSDIAKQISMDPSLTADILKTVHSAHYVLPTKIENIFEAVKILGLRGISNMLLSYGAQKVLKSNQLYLWDHSQRVAFFSYNLAKNFKKHRDLHDDVLVGGILHDIGKIVFSNIHPKLLQIITKFCAKNDFKIDILEELSGGMNHATIGGKIAQKWNFPPSLVAVIRYHHIPEKAPIEYKDAVNIVYIANSMVNFQAKTILFDQININILNEFGIKDKAQFKKISEKLTSVFEEESS